MLNEFGKELLYFSILSFKLFEKFSSISEIFISLSLFSKNGVFSSEFKIIDVDDIPSSWGVSVFDFKLSPILLLFVESILLILLIGVDDIISLVLSIVDSLL